MRFDFLIHCSHRAGIWNMKILMPFVLQFAFHSIAYARGILNYNQCSQFFSCTSFFVLLTVDRTEWLGLWPSQCEYITIGRR